MILIELTDIKKEINGASLFEIDHLQVDKQARIGLIGKNGSGKSTLLNLIAGHDQPEHGHVKRFGTMQLLPQLKDTSTTESGGEVSQRYIDKAIAKKADLLLADEPTTNLDKKHIDKLAQQFKRWHGAIIVVAHDRYFLDTICKQIWVIDQKKIKVYQGNYSDYQKQVRLEIEQQEAAYQQYLQTKRQLERALVLKEQKAQRATKKPKQVSRSEAKITGAKPYFAKKQKKLEQTKKAIETRLNKLEKVDKVYQEDPIKMELPEVDRLTGRVVIRAANIEGYVGARKLWAPASFQINGGDKVAIIGNNGVGKSTLVKQIIDQVEGMSLSPALKIGYFSQKLTELKLYDSILNNVRETSQQSETLIRTVLARLHFYRDDVYKPVEVLSGGERVKVTLAKLFVSHVNTLILDEPTNFLDLEAVEALESLLLDYPGTLIFVSHDQRLVEQLAEKLILIEHQQLSFFPGSLHDYQQRLMPEEEELDLMILETRISEVLGKLSIEPSEELEQEFQQLLKKKQQLNNDQ
nr:ABC-F type ribosomal protection protein [Amphibacillus sediminis]